MRTLRTTSLWALGLTAVFVLAQIGAALFLISRLGTLYPSGGPNRVLLAGLVLLLASAELLTAVGGSKSE